MIAHDDLSEMSYCKRIRELGLTDEYFFSLPLEFQKAIIMAGHEVKDRKRIHDNLEKKAALRQSEFEEKVKEKVLTLLKKNR